MDFFPHPVSSILATTTTRKPGSRSLRASLLGSCAGAALLALPVIVPMSVGLAGSAAAQVVSTGTNSYDNPSGSSVTSGTLGFRSTSTSPVTLTNEGTLSGTVGGVGVNGASGTVINSGTINGTSQYGVYLRAGGSITNSGTGTIKGDLVGVYIFATPGTLSNSGTIAGASNDGVRFSAGGSVTDSGRITSGRTGVSIYGGAGTVTNSGTLAGASNTGVALHGGGSVTNSGTGAITGGQSGIVVSTASGTVTNSSIISGASNSGVALNDGGSVANSGGGSIRGALSGVYINAASGVVTNSGTIAGTSHEGIKFEAGGSIDNSGTVTGGQTGASIYGASGTVTNSGIIGGTSIDGVFLKDGGSVANTGAMTGALSGVYIGVAPGVVTNSGTISGSSRDGVYLQDGGSVTNSGTGTITGGLFGVNVATLPGSVTNSGTITNTGTSGAGVNLSVGGSVSNAATGTISGRRGVSIYGVGSVTNDGTISGIERSGVLLAGGGIVTNDATGLITGGTIGIASDSGTIFSTVVNAGTITGGNGVQLGTGGSVANLGASATITAVTSGVVIAAGAGTVTNTGTIQSTGTSAAAVYFDNFASTLVNGGTIIGNSGTAVQFGNANNLLELLPGAVFVGVVNGGTGSNTMEFGAGTATGSFTGLGSSNFTGFNTVKVDAAASWNLTGTNLVASGVSLTNAGSLTNSGTLTNNGSFVDTGLLTNNGSIVGNVALSATSTLVNTGSISVASGAAVTVTDGVASITNKGLIQATGTDGVGVLFTGSASGVVDNFGTIAGGSGTAVKFAGGTNTLIIESGGVLSGLADGSAGTNTLVFEGTGSLTNAQILGFQTVQFANSSGSVDSASTVNNASVTGTLANAGTLTGTLTVATGATLTNGGIVNTTTASTNSGNLANSGTLANSSTLTNAGQLANSGALNNTGTLDNTGSLTNTGTITTTGGMFATSGSFTNAGAVSGDTNGIVGSGAIANSGTIIGTAGTGIVLTGAGTVTNAAGGLIQGGQYGVQVASGGTINNAGTILDNTVAGASLGSGATMSNAATGTIGGVIGVEFTGTGATLTNNGTITGTGGIAVQFDAGANALVIGSGSVLTGAIDGGTGAGQITLTGAGSIANTIQNFGAGSALTIVSGADWTATGNWTIAGVTNAGVLQPGVAGSPLKLTGDFTQASTGMLQVALNADGTGSELQVTGKVTLGGTVAIVPSFTTLTGSKTYTIVTATDGVSGTFGGSTLSTNLLTDVLTYDADDAFVTLFQRSIAANIQGSKNEHNVAVAIDQGSAANSVGFSAAIAGIDTLSTANVRSALDRLSGESHASLATTALQAGSLFANQFHQQGVLARLGDSGTASGQTAMLAGGRQNLARLDGGTDDPSVSEADRSVADADMPWGVWASGYGQTGQLSGDGNSHRLDETIAGGTVGADYKVLPNLRVGAGIGYGGTTFSLDNGGGRGQVDHTQFAVYGDYTLGAVYVDTMVGYAYGDGTTSRNVSLPGTPATAYAHTTDNQVLGSVEAGYALPVGGIALTPFVGLTVGSVDQDGFVENGAGVLNLRVRDQSASSVKSAVGARVTADMPVGGRVITTDLSAGWAHEYAPTNRSTVAAFAGAPAASFQVAGAKVPGDSAQVGFGLATAVFANTSLYAHYDGDLASGASSNAITAGFRFNW